MSRLTDLLEEHTAEAVWAAVQELAHFIEERASETGKKARTPADLAYAQGLHQIKYEVWGYIGRFDPNPAPDEE